MSQYENHNVDVLKNKTCTYLISVVYVIVAVFSSHGVFAATINATITPGIFEPSAPVNLAASVDDRSIDLSWSVPASNGGVSITDYVIEYKITSIGTWATFSDGVSTETSVTVTSLTNDTSYDFRVSAVNSVGQGDSSSSVSATPGPPAQVIVQSVSDTTLPSIAAAVRITNEGGDAYEYQYTWCLTDSDTNLCGGGDDVFNSSAAKLIQSGEDWDTILSATANTIGSYWFHLDVEFGSDSSQASQSFTATSESLGGGSGGGGSRRGTSISTPNTQSGTPIGADFNGDGKVGSVDFSIFLAFWNQSPPFTNPYVDINRDDKVDSIDFSILLYRWGKKPIPIP